MSTIEKREQHCYAKLRPLHYRKKHIGLVIATHPCRCSCFSIWHHHHHHRSSDDEQYVNDALRRRWYTVSNIHIGCILRLRSVSDGVVAYVGRAVKVIIPTDFS